MDKNKMLELMNEIFNDSIGQSSVLNDMMMHGPAVLEAETTMQEIIETLEIPLNVKNKLQNAIVSKECADIDAAILYGMQVILSIIFACFHPHEFNKRVMERVQHTYKGDRTA